MKRPTLCGRVGTAALCCLISGVFGACTLGPKVGWRLPIEVRDTTGPLAGVEVAADGVFAGTTDADGKVTVRLEAPARASVPLSLRDPGLETLHLARVETLRLPGLWDWIKGAGLDAQGDLPTLAIRLERIDAAPDAGPETLAEEAVEAGLAPAAAEVTKTTGVLASESPLAPEALPAGIATSGASGAPGANAKGTPAAATPNAVVHGHEDASAVKDAVGEALTATPFPLGTASAEERKEKALAETRVESPVPLPAARGRATLTAQIFSGGKPLAGAEVFSIRKVSGRIVRLGESSDQGALESDHPAILLGESLFVRHACCASAQVPLAALTLGASALETSVARKARIDLSPGVSHDFVFVEQAFGQPRVLEKASLISGGRTLDLTGPTGLAIVTAKNLPAGLAAVDVGGEGVLPARRPFALSVGGATEEKPFVVRLSPARKRLAQVGLVEMVKGSVVQAETHLQGEPAFRRARRDFLSRFVQERAFRPLIFQEVKKLADAARLDPTQLVRRGWELGPLAGEMDFLAVLEVLPEGGFVLRVVNGEGGSVAKRVFRYGATGEPERAGKAAFETLLETLPFELTVSAIAQVAPSGTAQARARLTFSSSEAIAATLRSGSALRRVAAAQRNLEAVEVGVPCETKLGREPLTAFVEGACAGDVAVGDVFARESGRGSEEAAGGGAQRAD